MILAAKDIKGLTVAELDTLIADATKEKEDRIEGEKNAENELLAAKEKAASEVTIWRAEHKLVVFFIATKQDTNYVRGLALKAIKNESSNIGYSENVEHSREPRIKSIKNIGQVDADWVDSMPWSFEEDFDSSGRKIINTILDDCTIDDIFALRPTKRKSVK